MSNKLNIGDANINIGMLVNKTTNTTAICCGAINKLIYIPVETITIYTNIIIVYINGLLTLFPALCCSRLRSAYVENSVAKTAKVMKSTGIVQFITYTKNTSAKTANHEDTKDKLYKLLGNSFFILF